MKKTIFFILTLVFLFSSLNLTDEWNIKGVFLVYILLISLFIVPIFIKGKLKINLPTVITIYLFILFCVISSYVNVDPKSIFGATMIFILFIVSCIIVPSLNLNLNKIIVYAILISHFPLIIFPLIINGFDTNPYSGIFYNPNSMGTVAGTIFAVLFAGFLSDLEYFIRGYKIDNKKINIFIHGSLLLFSFYLITVSSSRTSFLAAILCVLVGITYLSVYLIKTKKFLSFIVKGGIFSGISALLLMLILKFTRLNEAIYNNIFYKFELRGSQSGVLSSRDDIWGKTIQEAGAFGNGNNYFTEMGIGAHNTFISILGEYGWFSLIIFITFLIIGLYYSAKYSLCDVNDRYKYVPLMMFIIFITRSMGEVMIFKISMIAMFFSLGAVMKRKAFAEKKISIRNKGEIERHIVQL
ncbi:hypothetical protein [Piscibacillus halophilus]|uniref:hypothetical protein n=1 Tax=Piscibacillus halophilus TaxID=571933 RepID=UPI00158C08FC|nr:hypothetical protein [Piscibacillus halophilus]